MVTNCPNCGSAIKTDGKFCNYCGAKLPDDTKRIEVKIDNAAEIVRAEYEAQESRLRQKKMERELRKEKRKPYMVLAKLLSIIIPFAIVLVFKGSPFWLVPGFGFLGVWLILFLVKI